MIELTVQAVQQSGGPIRYACEPQLLCLGAQYSSGMEQLQIRLPAQWKGMHAVFTLLPDSTYRSTGHKPLAWVIPEDGILDVTAAMTACVGDFVVSASKTAETPEQDRIAFSVGGRYEVWSHPASEGIRPTVTRTLYEQFLHQLDSVMGPQGESAYEVAVRNGFNGSETSWLASLKGEPGTDAGVTADSIQAALGYAPVSPTALTNLTLQVSAMASQFYGLRSSAVYTDSFHCHRTIALDPQYTSYNKEQYFVSVLCSEEYPDVTAYVDKGTGAFTVCFYSSSGSFTADSVVWFDLIVVISH